MSLIKIRTPALGPQVEPVLRDDSSSLNIRVWIRAAACQPRHQRRVIHGFRQHVLDICCEAVAQTAPQLDLSRVPARVPIRCHIDEPSGACPADRSAQWKCVRQELLHQARPFRSQVRCGHLKRGGQIALYRELPVLNVSHTKVRIDGEGCRADAHRSAKSICKRERIRSAVLNTQTFRKRRLLCHLNHHWRIRGSVAVNSVPPANDHRRRRDRPPCKTDARLNATPVRMQRAANDRCGGDEAGRDVEIDQASIEFRDRSFIFPSHAGVYRQAAVDPPVIGNEAVIEPLP